jgi:hypothetical protein
MVGITEFPRVISLGAAEAGMAPAPPLRVLFSCCEDEEELEWLESFTLEADDEDSVLAVVWLAPLTCGRGALILFFLAGTMGSF